jgi:hypothetical protein
MIRFVSYILQMFNEGTVSGPADIISVQLGTDSCMFNNFVRIVASPNSQVMSINISR